MFSGCSWPCSVQRQQVILTERWASQHKEIHFSSMHPGWADTPGEHQALSDTHLGSFQNCGSCRVAFPKTLSKTLSVMVIILNVDDYFITHKGTKKPARRLYWRMEQSLGLDVVDVVALGSLRRREATSTCSFLWPVDLKYTDENKLFIKFKKWQY